MTKSVSFQEVVQELKVTEATIRNWIKTGNIRQIAPFEICAESYHKFKNDVVGKDKLNKRANKLHADKTNHALIHADIAGIVGSLYRGIPHIKGEELSIKYETSLGESHRNEEGIFYTPDYIALELLACVENIDESTTFCDPCCGTGNFLMAALERGVKPENIYGFDTDGMAVEIAKARIYEKTGIKSENIKVSDFLEELSSSVDYTTYDLVFTNPPWGKKLTPKIKQKYGNLYNNGIKVDSSAIFALVCLKILNKQGCLGLLLPEAFFNVAAYKSVRQEFLKYTITNLIDYARPFLGLQTRAQAIVVKLEDGTSSDSVLCKSDNKCYEREQRDFRVNPNCIYNFYATDEESALIKHIYSFPHVTLEGRAKWALGIVTGNNKKFISPTLLEGYIPVYKGSDIQKDKFKEPSNFISSDFSQYQQVAPIELYQAGEKIVYRFISSKLVFAYDDKQRFFLNSANMLVLRGSAEISAKELSFLLNTKLFDWVFNKIFRTHKILRSDLETLPLFTGYFKACNEYTESGLYKYLGIEEKNGTFRIKR